MIQLPDLAYPYDALEPVISERALRTHHGKHHANYVTAVNALLERGDGLDASLEDVIRRAAASGDRKLSNNAGQAWNHGFFWKCMSPDQTMPRATLVEAIGAAFGDMAGLRTAFIAEGVAHFGSGWVWLVLDGDKLSVVSTHDGDTVILGGETPLLVCDLWEHAYYLDHMNDRAAYLDGWWDRLINWDFVQSEFEAHRLRLAPWRFGEPPFEQVPPITDAGGLQRVLAEVAACLDWPPRPGSDRERHFRQLVLAIEEYEARSPQAVVQAVSSSLDRRLREAAKTIAQRRQRDRLDPWRPLVGGDLRS